MSGSQLGDSPPSPDGGAHGPRPEAAVSKHLPSSRLRDRTTRLLGGLAAFLTVGPSSLLAIITVWAFAIFPWLRPWEPPAEQRLTITNVEIVERGHILDTQEEMTVIFVEVESVGYDRQPLRMATLWLDAASGQRVEPTYTVYGDSVHPTRNVHWVQWLNVHYPFLPSDSTGCLILRVIMYQAPDDELAAAAVPDSGAIGPQMVAYADSAPFDPYVFAGEGSCAAT